MSSSRYAEKIARIRKGDYRKGDFIIADAKDADVTGGVTAPGARRDASGQMSGYRTRPEFLDQIRKVITQDKVDILLASASNLEVLLAGGAFDKTSVQPAFRANETTDIWGNVRAGRYREAPSRPYRGASLAHAPVKLVLYSVTFNNNAEADARALEAYADFRREAEEFGISHFLEVFNPNIDDAVPTANTGAFVTDCIIRLLASLTKAERPEFLKVAYNGPEAMQELTSYDPSMVVGVLGGAGATHRDTFELIAQSERHGARIALFGRKINQAENQLAMIEWMKRVADREVEPDEAVRGYHSDLAGLGILPDRRLADDLSVTEEILRLDAKAA
ncbi:hypothetical protein [Notoacmeibacter sp. MSK16QG-6]|uniref:hypothetical protein n=1 Tax=Notoacmeibacter sp. MSK16QG-6 TaxID=2957982 RepID=UPI0020A14FFD|nr:hypothetical protein [Notoacmeibacter sp. MSK16QG-6]MCP1199592.1 hypothetical protein [Notoacmeibacter sp. MSK16QG-6]